MKESVYNESVMYEALKDKQSKNRADKAMLAYSNNYFSVKGIVIGGMNFEDLLMLSLRINEYDKAYRELRDSEPMLSGHLVSKIKHEIKLRFKYLDLLKEGKELDRAINLIKATQSDRKQIDALKKAISGRNLELKLNGLLAVA